MILTINQYKPSFCISFFSQRLPAHGIHQNTKESLSLKTREYFSFNEYSEWIVTGPAIKGRTTQWKYQNHHSKEAQKNGSSIWSMFSRNGTMWLITVAPRYSQGIHRSRCKGNHKLNIKFTEQKQRIRYRIETCSILSVFEVCPSQ